MASAALHLSLLCLLLAATTLQSKADANFIATTCSNTDRPDFCKSTLESDKRSINASTVAELAIIALDIAIKDASAVDSAVNDIANKNPGTPLEAAANQCLELYGNAVDDLREAQQDVGSQAYADAGTPISTAWEAPDGCEQAFSDNSVKSPVTGQNNRVRDEIGLCSQLTDLLV